MYLVLTALLALNVSKSVLDAFVAIEENIQKANLTELYRGDERKSALKETKADKSNPQRAKKAEKYLEVIAEIDQMTERRIRMIDGLKMEILRAVGEDVETIGPEECIIVSSYDAKKNRLKPTRMNLEFVNGKDKYDDPMRIMLGSETDIKRPTGKGLELWNSLLSFRKDLTEKIASTQLKVGSNGSISVDDRYHFKAPDVRDFKTQKELDIALEKAFKNSNVHQDDKAMIMEIYRNLTKQEYSEVHDVDGVHWIGKTFDHSPSVAAIASLSSLQKDILAARADALALISSRITTGEFSFSKIIPLAYGPEVVNANDEFTVEVLMAAYDEDQMPEVTFNGENISDVQGGKGMVKVKASGTEMELKGTVSIRNKNGVKKTLEWKKNVVVMKPSGSIELPELNVLYRGYPNKVNATASGFPTTILTAQGASITKSGGGYVVSPTGNSRKAYLTVSGKTRDGRTVQLKRVEYKVSRMPKPNLYIGAATDGDQIPPSGALKAKYDERTPLQATFRILSWECSVPGMQGAPPSGTGADISRARNLIRALRRGQKAYFTARAQGPDGMIQNVSSTFRK